jgi:Predicted nucleotide-binding protein containing TIR-like domain
MANVRPAVFIGSSKEGLATAEALQVLLDYVAEVEVWNQGLFGLSTGTLEELVASLDRFDFAVLVVDWADTAVSRGKNKNVPRDNVLFELGLFMGRLGRARTFMVFDHTKPPDLPSDLAGVTAATYQPHKKSGNLTAALGATSTKIKQSIQRLGLQEARSSKDVATAAETVRVTGDQMERLIKLLARSRKVELNVIASSYSSMTDRSQLMEMQNDLDDITRELEDKPD